MRGKALAERKQKIAALIERERAARCAWSSCRMPLPVFPVVTEDGRRFCSFDCKEADEEYHALRKGVSR